MLFIFCFIPLKNNNKKMVEKKKSIKRLLVHNGRGKELPGFTFKETFF